MKVLLDTNIIIHREASFIKNPEIGQLFWWLDKLHYDKVVHRLTIDELNKHLNEKTRQTMDAKIASYNQLKTKAPENDEINKIKKDVDKSENDLADSDILNEVYSNRVDFLISEDKKIHYKASLLGISDKVYRIETFLEKLIAENPQLVDYKVLSVHKELIGNIKLSDPFFDTLREDYEGFDKWFNKKAEEIAYTCYYKDRIGGFLYLKVETENENYANIEPHFSPKKRLKIGTFKVTLNGFRIGERFIKIIFDNAIQFKVDEIYVTIFERRLDQIRLINLLEEFGFKKYGIKKSTVGDHELVFARSMEKDFNKDNPRESFPYISKKRDVFIVPIYPEYHTELFPDSILRTESPNNFIENEPHRNAITKSYISHSIERNLQKGDIIIFYRTGGLHKSVVSTIGVIEEVRKNINNKDELIQICRKRTVLTDEELTKFWNRYPTLRPFVVNFLYVYSLPKRPNLNRLIELGIIADVKSAPRGFHKLDWEKLKVILKESNSDESIIVD